MIVVCRKDGAQSPPNAFGNGWTWLGASHYEDKSEKNNSVCEFHCISLFFISASSFTLSLVLDMAVHARFLLSIQRWRSLENFPEPATFKMALRAHSSESTYKAPSCASAVRYEFRSAKCM
jgi:hypothetical protein